MILAKKLEKKSSKVNIDKIKPAFLVLIESFCFLFQKKKKRSSKSWEQDKKSRNCYLRGTELLEKQKSLE